MNVEPYKNDFFKLTQVPRAVVSWLERDVAVMYRFYEEGAWYVHTDYIEGAQRIAASTASSAKTLPAQAVGEAEDYRTLYLQPGAPRAILDAVWRKLAQLHHPDKGGDPDVFQKFAAAYQRLKDVK